LHTRSVDIEAVRMSRRSVVKKSWSVAFVSLVIACSSNAPRSSGDSVTSNGIWENGIQTNGIWENGIWENGIWENGIWENGDWETEIWEKVSWDNGIGEKGIWEKRIGKKEIGENEIGETGVGPQQLETTPYAGQLLNYIYQCAFPPVTYDTTIGP